MKIKQIFSVFLIIAALSVLTGAACAGSVIEGSAADDGNDPVRVLYIYSSDLTGFRNNSSVNGTPFIVDKVKGYDGSSGWTEPSAEYLELAANGFAGYDVLYIDMVNLHSDELLAGFRKAADNNTLLISVKSAPVNAAPYMPDYFDIRESRAYSLDNDFTDRFFAIYDSSYSTTVKRNQMTALLVEEVLKIRSFEEDVFPTPAATLEPVDKNDINVLYVCSSILYFRNESVYEIPSDDGTVKKVVIRTLSGYKDSSGWTEPSDEYVAASADGFDDYDVLFIDMVNIYRDPIATAFRKADNDGKILIAVRTGPKNDTCFMPDFFDIRDTREMSPDNDFTDKFFNIHTSRKISGYDNKSRAFAELFAETVNKTGGNVSGNVTVSYTGGIVIPDWAPEDETIPAGSAYVISPYRACCEGYAFNGWIDQNGNEYAPGDPVTISRDVILEAQWISLESGFVPTLSDLITVNNIIIYDGDYVEKYDLVRDGEIDIFDLVLMAQYVADN